MLQDKDRGLAARIAAGERIAGPDEVTPGYRGELMRQMVVLVDSELAGAAGFADQINAAPTLADRVGAARIVSEKLFEDVKAGRLTGFSIGGIATVQELRKLMHEYGYAVAA